MNSVVRRSCAWASWLPAAAGIALLFISQIAASAQVRPGQFSWGIGIPYTEPVFQAPPRSYVEMDTVPLYLLISNSDSGLVPVNLRDVRAKLSIRIAPVTSQIEWPLNFTLRQNGSTKMVPLTEEDFTLARWDSAEIRLTAHPIGARRFPSGRYTLTVMLAGTETPMFPGPREYEFDIAPPTTPR